MIFNFLKVGILSLLLQGNQISEKQNLTKSTDVSSMAKSLGIVSINKAFVADTKTEYKIVANPKVVNDFNINLNDVVYEITEINGEINLHLYKNLDINGNLQFPDLKFKLSNGIIIDLQNNIQINDQELEANDKLHLQVLISMIILNEIKNPQSNIANNDFQGRLKSCDRTIAAIRSSRSSATNGVNSATNRFITGHADCTRVNGVDAGCIWGDYGCVASQEIHCTGGGCDVSYGSL